MARRASSSPNIIIFIVIGLVVLAAFAVGVTLLNKKKDPYGQLPLLPVTDAVTNANSLRGNDYKITGKVEERWVKNNFEGVHLTVNDNGINHSLFIRIPSSLERPNIERDRSYTFAITVGSGGVIDATGVERL